MQELSQQVQAGGPNCIPQLLVSITQESVELDKFITAGTQCWRSEFSKARFVTVNQ